MLAARPTQERILRRLGRGSGSGTRHLGDHIAAHDLDRLDLVDTDHPAEDGLDTHPGQPAQALDDLAGLGAVLANIEGERRRLLDGVEVAALLFAEPAQQVQLARDLRRGPDVASVTVPRHQRERPLFAAARDQDRRMGAAEALGHVERAPEPDVLTRESRFAAALPGPHFQAGLDRLLEEVEAIPRRGWKGKGATLSLLLVVPRADTEHRAHTRQNV